MSTFEARQSRVFLPRERLLLALALLGSLTLATGVAVWLLASGSPSSSDQRLSQAAAEAAFLEETGVKVARVAVTGGGGIVDLRYRVIDPDKAALVHSPGKPPTVMDERSGRVLDELFMGHAHKGKFKAGVAYYLLFVNRQGAVRPGGRVAVALGGVRLEHVLVR